MIARRIRMTDDDAIFEVKNIEGGDGPWVELLHVHEGEGNAESVLQVSLREFRWLIEEVGPTIIEMAALNQTQEPT